MKSLEERRTEPATVDRELTLDEFAKMPKISMRDLPADGIITPEMCNKNGEVIVLDLERGAAVIPASEVQALQRKEPLDRKEEK